MSLAAGCASEPSIEPSEGALTSELEELTAPEPDTASLTGCELYAEQPYWFGASIVGTGTWFNCPADASVTVVLRHDRSWWPDRTLASGSGRGSSNSIELSYACLTDFEPIKVFIEVRYGSRKLQSLRAVIPCG